MEMLLILAVVAALALAAVGVALALRRAPAADLAGRLDQLAVDHAAAQAQLSERLLNQERALNQALEERLTRIDRRMHEGLDKTAKRTHESMTDLRERLAKIDEAQKNITELSAQMVGLQDILANKQARGAFGEIQLNDLVGAALPPSAYRFQAQLANKRVADCLLDLPNPPGPIVIDAKFPLESYHKLRAAETDADQKQAGREFGTAINTHVRNIAERYILPGETAESALMFLPSEAVYAELHANFPEVVEKSYRARVWIVSPTTLMATLNTVRAVLKDVQMREQAHLIQDEVRRLLTDVARLEKRVGNLRGHFGQASKDIDEIETSAGKIARRGDRIEQIELGDDTETRGVEAEIAPAQPRLIGD